MAEYGCERRLRCRMRTIRLSCPGLVRTGQGPARDRRIRVAFPVLPACRSKMHRLSNCAERPNSLYAGLVRQSSVDGMKFPF